MIRCSTCEHGHKDKDPFTGRIYYYCRMAYQYVEEVVAEDDNIGCTDYVPRMDDHREA